MNAVRYVYNTDSYRSKREALLWSIGGAAVPALVMWSYWLIGYSTRVLYSVLTLGVLLVAVAWTWWKRRGRDLYPARSSSPQE